MLDTRAIRRRLRTLPPGGSVCPSPGASAPIAGIMQPVTQLGRQDGTPLIVDLRSVIVESWSDLWDALSGPCGLPSWFGRNLNAWWDTIQRGGISTVVDDHPLLVIRVRGRGLFADGSDGEAFIERTNECDYARADVDDT